MDSAVGFSHLSLHGGAQHLAEKWSQPYGRFGMRTQKLPLLPNLLL